MDIKKLLTISLSLNVLLMILVIVLLGLNLRKKPADQPAADSASNIQTELELPELVDTSSGASENADLPVEEKPTNQDVADENKKPEVKEPPVEPAEKVIEPESSYNIYQQPIVDKHQEELNIYKEPDSYNKTVNIYETDKEILKLSFYDFTDNCMTFIGDSITYGQGSSADEENNLYSFPRIIKDACSSYYVENMGVPGATVGSYIGDTSIINRIQDIPTESSIIVMMGGFNDFLNYNGLLGDDSLAPGTYTGDLHTAMQTLRDNHPDAEVFMVLTYRSQYEDPDKYPVAYAFDSFLQYQRQFAKEFDFNIIDLHKSGYLNNNDEQVYAEFFSDGIHPNSNGSKYLGIHILANIISTLAEKGYTEF